MRYPHTPSDTAVSHSAAPRLSVSQSLNAYLHSIPGTTTWLFTLFVSSLTLRTTSLRLRENLLRQQSTNLHNMGHHPVNVLFVSAFWVQSARTAVWILPFLLVVAPVERWLGTFRWFIVASFGHVLATLVTTYGVWVVTKNGTIHKTLTRVTDVGPSYAWWATAGILVYLLPRRWRYLWLLMIFGYLGFKTVSGPLTFDDLGHVSATLIGLACYPLTKSQIAKRGQNYAFVIPWRIHERRRPNTA